ncbi:MAG: hypothetical protein WDZ76_01350 [Pseudohongiellaceae bacterium]
MRGLAQFVLSGRKQAILATALSGALPLVNFLSAALLALVMLRKGAREAATVLPWVLLPVGAWAVIGDVMPLVVLLSVALLAWLLRSTQSWEFTLLAAVLVGVAVDTYLRVNNVLLDTFLQEVEAVIVANNMQTQGFTAEELREPLIGLIAAVYMTMSLLLLILARWMQALLFNPGGFRNEFHALRIERKVGMVLLGLLVLASFGVVVPVTWTWSLLMPLVFSGVALVHAVIARKQLASLWLVVFYSLLVLPLTMQVVVLLALVDSFYDFRRRLPAAPE